MTNKFLSWLVAAAFLISGIRALAADKSEIQTELKDLLTKVRTKLSEHKTSEADLSDELKQFDALLEKHKSEKTDDVAQILMLKSVIYGQVLHDKTKSEELIAQLKKDFPDTETAKRMVAQEEAQKVNANLVEGKQFPDFDEKDTAGKSLSIAGHKGKVVLVDFWATWCPPCRGEVPNVVKTYEKHHEKGFDIIGVSLDQDKSKLETYTKEQNMTWQQYFDGKGWGNKLAAKYGIQSIPATFLLNGSGKIIGKNLRGEELESAVAKALEK